jgi:hypothetical protein
MDRDWLDCALAIGAVLFVGVGAMVLFGTALFVAATLTGACGS